MDGHDHGIGALEEVVGWSLLSAVQTFAPPPLLLLHHDQTGLLRMILSICFFFIRRRKWKRKLAMFEGVRWHVEVKYPFWHVFMVLIFQLYFCLLFTCSSFLLY